MALSSRKIYGIGFIICVFLFSAALYFQFVEGLEPCALCIMQRVIVLGLGFFMLIAALHNSISWGRYVYGILILITALCGMGVSGRQVWLQLFPPAEITTCGAGLVFMIQNLPLGETLRLVFQGSGECDKVQWTFLGLSMAGWMLLFFSGFAVTAIIDMIIARKQRSEIRLD